MRVHFETVFESLNDRIIARHPVRVEGVTTQPGKPFRMGGSLSGIELTEYIGNDLEVSMDWNGVIIVKGIYA